MLSWAERVTCAEPHRPPAAREPAREAAGVIRHTGHSIWPTAPQAHHPPHRACSNATATGRCEPRERATSPITRSGTVIDHLLVHAVDLLTPTCKLGAVILSHMQQAAREGRRQAQLDELLVRLGAQDGAREVDSVLQHLADAQRRTT